MLKAVYPGSFDPPTNGHMNVIERASRVFGELYVVIAVNEGKKFLFSREERVHMMEFLLKDYQNVHLRVWDRLIVDFVQQENAKVLLRGVRALSDFSYEFELAMTNKGLNPDIETMFIPTDPKYFVLRSSAIKEIALYGGDVSSMVPGIVAKALKEKLEAQKATDS